MPSNQNPEQKARDNIDAMLVSAGWDVQKKEAINWEASQGVAVKEYPTDTGPVDYLLFVDRNPVGVVEAKREEEGHNLTVVETQSQRYASGKLKWIKDNRPIPFIYESTGTITRFTDNRDPKPRSREIFHFHRPESFAEYLKHDKALRARLLDIPALPEKTLRKCQIKAINNLEKSFKASRPKALLQMATGSGKTYTAITFVYRLLKYANAKRILFLVDTKNLGEQAEQEFNSYQPNDDNRSFTELYNVQRLNSRHIASDSQVCISTIQRMYSILRGQEMDEAAEETSLNEIQQTGRTKEVTYNGKVPIEHFDFVIVDECHRSIYNLWKQVFDYFDSFIIGLTATPDKRTFGFFNENVVSEYTHEQAVADGVNVGSTVYTIETEITKNGEQLKAKQYIDKRDRLTRKERWEQLDEDVKYEGKDLDRSVVNKSQIRNIIKAFKNALPVIFPDREETPKTLIFAKSDSHADDIIKQVREEFGEENNFCKKITCQAKEDPKTLLGDFRNGYNPRIAVTVDMIATGTDIKALECLLFMRDVKSKNYFEQMKGRGTRTLKYDDLKKVTPSANSNKTHFVIVDAIGVTKSIKTDSRPLERKPTISLKNLLMEVLMGADDEDTLTSLANRLGRIEKKITEEERSGFKEKAGGKSINEVVTNLLDAFNPDIIDKKAQEENKLAPSEKPTEEQIKPVTTQLAREATKVFSGDLNTYIENVRRNYDQIIDTQNIDKVTSSGWSEDAKEKATQLVQSFTEFIETHKDEITALSLFYGQPYRRRELTYKMIQEILEILKRERPNLAPLHVWAAYEQLEKTKGKASPKSELTALVSLIRRVSGIDSSITAYEHTVDKNFADWVFKKQSGAIKFNEEQMAWLRMLKEHILTSFHVEKDDLEFAPFVSSGGMGKMYQLFGNDMDNILTEMNEALAV